MLSEVGRDDEISSSGSETYDSSFGEVLDVKVRNTLCEWFINPDVSGADGGQFSTSTDSESIASQRKYVDGKW